MSTFLVDDPEIAAYGEDLFWPFDLTSSGDLRAIDGAENLRQAMEIRAVTGRGEVLYQPLDGIDFDEFENGVADDISAVKLRARLVDQYQTREDRLTDVAVTVTTSGESTSAVMTGTGVLGMQTAQVDYA